MIPCCHRAGSGVFLAQTAKYFLIFALTFAYSVLFSFENDMTYLILHYRAFNRLFHAPFEASFESFILFLIMAGLGGISNTKASNFLILFIVHFAWHRL